MRVTAAVPILPERVGIASRSPVANGWLAYPMSGNIGQIAAPLIRKMAHGLKPT